MLLTRYRQRILCYILSHVNGCQLPNARISLLQAIEDISDSVKSRTLLPALHALTDDTASEKLRGTFGLRFEEYSTLVVSSLDSSAVPDLNDSTINLWLTFLSLIRSQFRPGE